ncbi:hypothetical protein FHR37_004746 [Actinopolymorpha cephalotaxi]|uniref:Uncharacterized protein n=1 Tax=Actinopolymorpha cephalotaxi TaxID=504797 RepID=A0ABX2S8G6_9ACTN|nr:hypothetical protein [Actinopolymorpha cephalotaxi]NYH85895.1 hypothetical protein [Actinopolymorpha cephalotaxi]
MTAASRTATPAPSVTTPATSGRRRMAARDSRSASAPSTPATAEATAYAQKNARQEDAAARPAAASGPSAMPAPRLPPHSPVARTRWCPAGNSWPMIPSVATRIAAPAPPCTTRARTRTSVVPAVAATTLPATDTAVPSRNSRRRPWLSARLPATRSREARPSAMPLRIQVCPVVSACRSAAIRGSTVIGWT